MQLPKSILLTFLAPALIHQTLCALIPSPELHRRSIVNHLLTYVAPPVVAVSTAMLLSNPKTEKAVNRLFGLSDGKKKAGKKAGASSGGLGSLEEVPQGESAFGTESWKPPIRV
jgi:hypothetical protein